MPIKLALKPKVAPAIEKTVTTSDTSQEISDLIDKIGGMQDGVTKALAKIKRDTDTIVKPYKDALKKLEELLDKVPEKDLDKEFEQHGVAYEAIVAKAMTVRTLIDVEGAIKKLNKAVKGDSKLGFKLATITLTNLDKYLSPVEQADLVTKTRAARTLKEIRKRTAA